MYDFQNTVMVRAIPNTNTKIIRYVTLILAALGLLAVIWINPILCALPALLLIILWWWCWFRTGIEYEYTYFDGDLDFDRIRAQRKRKNVISVHMDQVLVIAPQGHETIERAMRQTSPKCYDVTSGKLGRDIYELVWQDKNHTIVIKFEPTGKFLDMIAVKYRSKVIREIS